MSFLFKRNQPKVQLGAIGLEFSLEQINMVQLERISNTRLQVRSWLSIPYPETREDILENPFSFKKLINQCFRTGNFSGRRIVTILPSNQQKILSVNYQLEKDLGDSETIMQLMTNRLPGKLSDYVIDYLPVRSSVNKNSRHAVVVAAPEVEVLKYLQHLNSAGLDVEQLEIGPTAIKRLVGSLSSPSEGLNVLVVNFGSDSSYVTMISGRRLLFDEQINFGEISVLGQMSEVLEMPAEQVKELVLQLDLTAQNSHHDWQDEINNTLREMVLMLLRPLADEVNRTLIYAASETRGEAVEHLYILGSIARWPGIQVLLSELLGLNVEIMPNPLSAFNHESSDIAQKDVPEIAVATGLALRGIELYE